MKELKDMSREELWALFPIILRPYNPAYPAWYEEEKESLAVLFGAGIFRIHHIGSTSVKGLIAKPIVDILLELMAGISAETVIGTLQKAGWILMALDDAAGMLDFNKGYTPQGFAEKVFHLHVKPPGDWGELYFRDYLRGHPDISREYEKLKLMLQQQYEHDRDAYTEAKTDFIETHTRMARSEFAGRYAPAL